jgi:hypothetical protein
MAEPSDGQPRRDYLYPPDDFEALIRIYGPQEGGRCSAVFNGICWDVTYEGQPERDMRWMIWPDFFGADGRSLPTDEPLPIGVELPARMTVVMDAMRAEVHRGRIAERVRFFCHEGARRVAEGVVTRITGLFTPRESREGR